MTERAPSRAREWLRPKSETARVEVLCVGTELLAGKVNTHVSWFASALRSAGLALARETSVPDSADEIRDAARAALDRSDAVIVTGGLGPTFDDLSREGVAAALGLRLEYRPAIFRSIVAKFRRYGHRRIPAENKRQAYVLEGARVLPNPHGSAPGQMLTVGSKTLALLPGPADEMKPLFEARVLPVLRRRYAAGAVVRARVLRLCGISESAVDERFTPLYATARPGSGLEFTILSEPGLVDLHVTATARSTARASRLLEAACGRARRLAGPFVYGEDSDTLESVVGGLLRGRRRSLAVAESCTGGLLGARLTSAPGSSDYFLGGTVCYSNEAKTRELGVAPELLAEHGAVSAECATAMALGAARRWSADCAVSITGVAGPAGGTPSKPVGLVYIGLSTRPDGAVVTKARLHGGREQVRRRAATSALILLWKNLSRPVRVRGARL